MDDTPYDQLVRKKRLPSQPRTNFADYSTFMPAQASATVNAAQALLTTYPTPLEIRSSTNAELIDDYEMMSDHAEMLHDAYQNLQQMTPSSGELKQMSDALTKYEDFAREREYQVDALSESWTRIKKLYAQTRQRMPKPSLYPTPTKLMTGTADKAVYLEHLRSDFDHSPENLKRDLAAV